LLILSHRTKSLAFVVTEDTKDEEGEEGAKPERTKKKSALERRLAEKMAAAGESKSEQELVQEVVAELKEKENKEGRC
jgi:hypothetical protein